MLEAALTDSLTALAFVAGVIILAAIVTVIANLTSGSLHDLNSKPNLKDLRNKKFKTRNPRNNLIT